MPSGSGKTQQSKAAKFATLESLKELTDQRKTIEIDGFGTFEIRQLSVQEFLTMQEDALGDDGEFDEWEGTKLLLSASVTQPPLADDPDLIGDLPLSLTRQLTEQIAAFSGTDDSFTGGSPTE